MARTDDDGGGPDTERATKVSATAAAGGIKVECALKRDGSLWSTFKRGRQSGDGDEKRCVEAVSARDAAAEKYSLTVTVLRYYRREAAAGGAVHESNVAVQMRGTAT